VTRAMRSSGADNKSLTAFAGAGSSIDATGVGVNSATWRARSATPAAGVEQSELAAEALAPVASAPDVVVGSVTAQGAPVEAAASWGRAGDVRSQLLLRI
jgi:hypothetical protein